MINYIIQGKKFISSDCINLHLFDTTSTFSIANPEEVLLITDIENVSHYTLKESSKNNHHLRVDYHEKYSYGILNTFEIIDDNIVLNDFKFYLTSTSLLLVIGEDNTIIKDFVKTVTEDDFAEKCEEISPQRLLLLLIDEIIENNEKLIEKIEDNLEVLEEKIFAEVKKEYSKDIISKRKLIMHFKHNLESFPFIIQLLGENENNLFNKNQEKLIRILEYKSTKMIDNINLLRDYATQVREAWEAEQDINSNEVMKFFTVITSIFLPLTLIAGWYGMNFNSMPEITFKFGYLYAIVLSLIVLMLPLIYFKKKKWL